MTTRRPCLDEWHTISPKGCNTNNASVSNKNLSIKRIDFKKKCNPNSIDKVRHPNVLFVLTPFVSAMPICFSSHDTKNIQIPIFFSTCGKLDFPNPKKMRLTLFWNPTAGSRVPKFQRCGSVSVFGFGQKTMHHCQTHTLKPNSHHCWFCAQQI